MSEHCLVCWKNHTLELELELWVGGSRNEKEGINSILRK